MSALHEEHDLSAEPYEEPGVAAVGTSVGTSVFASESASESATVASRSEGPLPPPRNSTYACFQHHPALAKAFASLSTDQQYAFAQFAAGKNIFVTGPGGTGKTRFIQFLVQFMESRGIPHQVCAMTGCAAVLLNCKAKTIHSWSGVRLAKGDAEDTIARVLHQRASVAAWKKPKVLIVDEVSMLSNKLFGILDHIGRAIFRVGRPFGGLQLVFTGDFFQLPPIGDDGDPTSGEFCFRHPRWATTFPSSQCIELRTFFRQQDPRYIRILQEIREGRVSEESVDTLRQRMVRPDPTGVPPTQLFPLRAKVDSINSTCYGRLGHEEKSYLPIVQTDAYQYVETGQPIPASLLTACHQLGAAVIDMEVSKLLDSLQTERTVRLKKGALVMCTANIDVENGICNGSQGTIVDFVEVTTALPPKPGDAQEAFRVTCVPVVQFLDGVQRRVGMFSRQSEEYPTVVVSQIPLRLAWAVTIHKSQGATLDLAQIDIGKSVFEHGQSYVALSRVKTLDGLFLSDFDPEKIRANPQVVEFYRSFPRPDTGAMHAYIDRTLVACFGKPGPAAATTVAAAHSTPLTKRTTNGTLGAVAGTLGELNHILGGPSAESDIKRIKMDYAKPSFGRTKRG